MAFTHENLNCVILIKKRLGTIKMVKSRNVSRAGIFPSLSKLTKVEGSNNKNELSTYYKFLSTQMILIYSSFNERSRSEKWLTICCSLQLHYNNTSRREMTWKKTLFDANAKSVIPPDWFFNEEIASPNCNILNKITEVLPKIDRNKNWDNTLMILHCSWLCVWIK